ncbi:another transcription unit protein isoform X3 [Drosophila subpulchrella]|uniref:another transcription unit protein isoform X3 n=1 Tax=Drosophila subpulchrella TaxID=1486046 RepID=UPI0018A15678|nr:another transcription unit protein isoform X3 [Drosophila subpulchrella]
MADPSVHPQYRDALVTDDKISGTPGYNRSSTGRNNRFREELQAFSKEDQEVGSITGNVCASKSRPYRPSINADKYFAKRIKKSAEDSNTSCIDGEELQAFSKEDQEVGSTTSNVCASKSRPYRPSINADKYFAKRIKKSAEDSNKSCIDGNPKLGKPSGSQLHKRRPSINNAQGMQNPSTDRDVPINMMSGTPGYNRSSTGRNNRDELQAFSKEDQEVGSVTSNVCASKSRLYRPSINADIYFSKKMKRSAASFNIHDIDGNPELFKPSGSQLHKRQPSINNAHGMQNPSTDRDVPINTSTSFIPIDESVFDELQLTPESSQSSKPRFSSQQSSPIANDKSSPSSDSDGKISPDLEYNSTGGLNPNTNYFGDTSEEEEEEVDGKKTEKSVWSELEISDSSGEETPQIEGAQLSIEEQHRQMLGNKLTAKFSATLPADNSALLDGQPQYLKMPHFIAVESKAYVAKDFKNAMTSEDLKDEQAREDFKNRLKTTVRWREDENKFKESNSRIVRWSDGSETFHVGGEVFDVMHHPVTNDQNHMYVRLESFYQPQVPIKDKMTLRPKLDSNFGQTHVQGMRNRAVNKPQTGIKVLMNTGVDPGQDRDRRVKEELAQLRLEDREKRRDTQMNRRKPPARSYESEVEGSNDEDNFAAASEDNLSDEPRPSTSKRKNVLQSDTDDCAWRNTKPLVYTDSDSSD